MRRGTASAGTASGALWKPGHWPSGGGAAPAGAASANGSSAAAQRSAGERSPGRAWRGGPGLMHPPRAFYRPAPGRHTVPRRSLGFPLALGGVLLLLVLVLAVGWQVLVWSGAQPAGGPLGRDEWVLL